MKKMLYVMLVLVVIVVFTGCSNRTMVDTTYSFERAIVALPNGTIVEGKVQSWKDYDGEQIQVKIDGKTYLTQISNVVLISE